MPSPEAQEIDRAHKLLRLALGTPLERTARAHLKAIVAMAAITAALRRSR